MPYHNHDCNCAECQINALREQLPDRIKANSCGLCNFCLSGQPKDCTSSKLQVDKQDGRAARSPLSKVRLDLIPVGPLVEVGRVFTFGALHYGDRNWEFGFSWMRCYGSILRHLWKWAMGATNDEESGCNHLAHVVANCLFLLEYAVTHREFDDRPINTGLDVLQYFQPMKNINDKE